MPGNFWRVSKLSLTGYTFSSLFYTQPFLLFVNSNYSAVVKGESELMLDSSIILVPLIVLLFAGLYKMAYLAAKDSNLAI